MTDAWVGYRGLKNHYVINHSRPEYHIRNKRVHTNTVEGLWSILKRSIIGTFHHVSVKYLPLYLNELAWRCGHRNVDLFELTMKRLLRAEHITYRELVRR